MEMQRIRFLAFVSGYRVRIALNLKQLSAEHAFHHLRKNGSQS